LRGSQRVAEREVLGVKSRVSSTVTKRKPNPRPRKYASASERQAAYRARAPEMCFRAEDKTVDTLDRIAADLDVSRADLLLSMTKFALTNYDWSRFGLTHKPLPFGYGAQDETRKENPAMKFTQAQLDKLREEWKRIKGIDPDSPNYAALLDYLDKLPQSMLMQLAEASPRIPFVSGLALNRVKRKSNPMKTTTKRKPTPAQLAARERFAEAARSGAFKKAGASRRKKNPQFRSVRSSMRDDYDQLDEIERFVLPLIKPGMSANEIISLRADIRDVLLGGQNMPEGGLSGEGEMSLSQNELMSFVNSLRRMSNPAKPAASRRVNPVKYRDIAKDVAPGRVQYAVHMPDRPSYHAIAYFTKKADAVDTAQELSDRTGQPVAVTRVQVHFGPM